MNVLVAIDSFKQSISAQRGGDAIVRGIKAASPDWEVVNCPLADGGEGSLAVVLNLPDFSARYVTAITANHELHSTAWAFSRSGAFIEMAATAGMNGLKGTDDGHPLTRTSRGVGQQILAALSAGCQQITIGIGGSATHDCGVGMAAELGYRFFDAADNEIILPTGKDLGNITKIDDSGLHPLVKAATFFVLCDVSNPLYGPDGAAYTYAQQKGAAVSELAAIDSATSAFAKAVQSWQPQLDRAHAGGGAAGGFGFGATAFLGASLTPGAAAVAKFADLAAKIDTADFVITGEGMLDRQTQNGKLVAYVAELCQQRATPVIALCGAVCCSPTEISQLGLSAAFSIVSRAQPLSEALAEAEQNLEHSAWNIAQLIKKLFEFNPST